jgi:uncharacterized protein (TIGR04255 family)
VSDYKKLNNQPLQIVLAEFRFTAVLQMEEFVPALQEALRKKYPITQIENVQASQVGPAGICMTSIQRWLLISANKSSAIIIQNDRLVFLTSEYPRFEGFSELCKEALDTLENIVEPSLITRIGLRYGNLIQAGGGETIDKLVCPHLTMPDYIESIGELKILSNEMVITTSVGTLLLRSLYGNHNMTCLPDIQGIPVTIRQDKESSERIILDFDHFWDTKNNPVTFDTEGILSTLEKLHVISREAFWKATTDYARNEKWA